MRAAEMFRNYPKMKQELLVLEFKLRDFKGIPREDIIESMNFSRPEGERVQENQISDKTGKIAIHYRQVADRMDEEYFEGLFHRYQYLKEELEFFEFLVAGLGDRLSDFIRDNVMSR